MKRIGIIFAMKEELDSLLKYLKIEKEYNIFDLKFYEGMIHNNYCILTESGVGKVNSARCTQILIDNMDVDMIINIGVAGGISEKLKVCDIVIGEKLVQHDFDITAFNHEKGYIPNVGVYIDSDTYLVNIAKECINNKKYNVVSGIIASGDIFCTESWMSKKINTKFNALCVEMEGASIAQVCYLSNIPFIVIRSISDVPNNNNVLTYEEFLNESSKNVSNFIYEIIKNIK
ncbi:MAG: 5'-methylthioadenosine/adenosylhomocysteine nucleosidase [Bacilli bacterium]|nr:5'-methylthioadenosine/adenosylhomocysteine nucleosidase [Bacilli bacterium]